MAWSDRGLESYKGDRTKAAVKKIDVGDIYKWYSMRTVVNAGRPYDSKVEYLVRHGNVISCHITSLQQPLADFDITEQVSTYEMERIIDIAQAHYEQECKSRDPRNEQDEAGC